MGRACSTNGEKRNSDRLLVGRAEEKRKLGTPRWRWVDNIKIDLGEIGCGGVDRIGLRQDMDRGGGGSCECGNETFGFHKMLGSDISMATQMVVS
jgi:hypothetical protein